MHPKYQRAHKWSREVIGAAIEVHKTVGPGLLESVYQQCLFHELALRGIPVSIQTPVAVRYKELVLDEALRGDLVVDGCLVIELKAVETILPIHKAQLFTYMKLLDAPIGLLINFHECILKNGLYRMVLPGANLDETSLPLLASVQNGD